MLPDHLVDSTDKFFTDSRRNVPNLAQDLLNNLEGYVLDNVLHCSFKTVDIFEAKGALFSLKSTAFSAYNINLEMLLFFYFCILKILKVY